MHPGWSADFRYAYFRQLLHTVRTRFTAHILGDAIDLLPHNGSPLVFLRHDIKFSLHKALCMAEIENTYGLPTSYMVRVDSPLYSLAERQARITLLEIAQLGHEIGLHFDLAHETHQSQSYLRLAETEISTACERIEQITGRPVRSLSFQRPLPLLFEGPLLLNGRVNADSRELRAWYLADAGGSWCGGEPCTQITKNSGSLLQIILHPLWWDETHAHAPQRLQEFFDLATREKPVHEASLFDIHLAKTLPGVHRQTLATLLTEEMRQ